jgi:hypothetical protein
MKKRILKIGAVISGVFVVGFTFGQCGNLLVNGGFESGVGVGWTNGSGNNVFALTTETAEVHSGSNAIKSGNLWCIQEQTIDLIAKGFTAQELDAKPTIYVSEWYRGVIQPNYPEDLYYYKAELLDSTSTVVATHALGSNNQPVISTADWQQVSHSFTDYPVGVRYVRILHGGKDTENWGGEYGTIIDDSWVKVSQRSTDTIVACNSYTWRDGVTYTESTSTPIFSVVNADYNGCDTLVKLNLTILTLDTAVVKQVNTLIATDSTASYQWLNCADSFAVIANATAATFSPTANGSYAVVLSKGACSDTSACFSITGLGAGLKEGHAGKSITIFPNPSTGSFQINCGDLMNVQVRIFDASGKVLWVEKEISSGSRVFDCLPGAGVYFVEVSNGSFLIHRKLIRN